MQVAVIGYGRWGPNQARVFGNRVTISAIADMDMARLDAAATRFPSALHCTDYRDAVSTADVVVVATPVHTHEEIVEYALVQGRHVLCEKPLCLDPAVARRLHRIAGKYSAVLMTGYTYLYNGRATWMRYVDYGKIHTIRAHCTGLGPIRTDVGVVADLMTHYVALLQSWMGAARMVSCTGQRCLGGKQDDVATVCLLYPGGVYASIYASWIVPHKSRHLQVVGEKCTAEWDDANTHSPICVYSGGAQPREYYDTEAGFMHLAAWTGNRTMPSVPYVEPLQAQADQFLSHVQQRDCDFARFDECVCATLDAALRSKEAYGEPTTVKGSEL